MELNRTEKEIDEISIVGRFAFGLSVAEKYIFENKISNTNITKLLPLLYQFLEVKDLDIWDSKISQVDPSYIINSNIDSSPENYNSSNPKLNAIREFYLGIPKELITILNNLIGIGTANLYCGYNSEYTKGYVLKLIKLNNELLKSPVNFIYFTKFTLITGKEWGNKIPLKEIKNGW